MRTKPKSKTSEIEKISARGDVEARNLGITFVGIGFLLLIIGGLVFSFVHSEQLGKIWIAMGTIILGLARLLTWKKVLKK